MGFASAQPILQSIGPGLAGEEYPSVFFSYLSSVTDEVVFQGLKMVKPLLCCFADKPLLTWLQRLSKGVV